MLLHPGVSCWASSELECKKQVLETPTPGGDQGGSCGWHAVEKFSIPQKSDGKRLQCLALEGDLLRKAQHGNQPPSDAGGAARQSSSCCPRHEATLQVDMTSRNTDFLKWALFVCRACWPRAEINMRTHRVHIVEENNTPTKCPNQNLRVTEPRACRHNQVCL